MTKTTKEILLSNPITMDEAEYLEAYYPEESKQLWFSRSDFEQLRQELKDKIQFTKIPLDELGYPTQYVIIGDMGSKINADIDSVFAKYGVDDSNESHLNEGRSEGVNPSNPNKCPKCNGKGTIPLFDARGYIDGGEICQQCKGKIKED